MTARSRTNLKMKSSKLDVECAKLNKRQEKRYELMQRLKIQYKKMADRIIRLELEIEKLQKEIDY